MLRQSLGWYFRPDQLDHHSTLAPFKRWLQFLIDSCRQKTRCCCFCSQRCLLQPTIDVRVVCRHGIYHTHWRNVCSLLPLANRRRRRDHSNFHWRPTSSTKDGEGTLLMKKRMEIPSRCFTLSTSSFLTAVQSYDKPITSLFGINPAKNDGEYDEVVKNARRCMVGIVCVVRTYCFLPSFHSSYSSTTAVLQSDGTNASPSPTTPLAFSSFKPSIPLIQRLILIDHPPLVQDPSNPHPPHQQN